MDFEKAREQNFKLNKPKPIVEEPQKGSVGDRNPETGKSQVKEVGGGTYEADLLFDSSVGSETLVQVNPNVRTADYRSAPQREKTAEGAKLERAQAATGVPNPDVEEDDDDETDEDNENFGNCQACKDGARLRRISCTSQFATITFEDGETERIQTPAELEFGVKVKYRYASGKSGEEYFPGCAAIDIGEGTEEEPQGEPLNTAIYGTRIYSQKASSVTLPNASGSGLKAFELYQLDCNITVIGVSEDGSKSVLGATTWDNLEGGYTVLADSTCIRQNKAPKTCDVDPETIEYFCVVRGFRICRNYRVTWTLASTGEETYKEDCDQVGYEIVSEPDESPYRPGPRNVGTGFLVYDSGIPRKFTVQGTTNESSGDFAYFQVYTATDNPCSVEIVGVKVTGSKGGFNGASVNKEYETIYTGKCGDWQVTLGDYVADSLLRIYNRQGEVILETSDFIPDSVEGCRYVGGSGLGTKFEGDCRSQEETRSDVFEREADANNPLGANVASIECDVVRE